MNFPDPQTVDFSIAIRAAATEAGRAPTAEQVAALQDEARASARYDFGKGMVIERDGQSESFAAWLSGELPKLPLAAHQIDPVDIPAVRSSEPQWTRGRNDVFANMVRAGAQAHDEALAREAEGWANPFIKRNWNLTRQTIMKNKHPTLWAKMKAEAGV